MLTSALCASYSAWEHFTLSCNYRCSRRLPTPLAEWSRNPRGWQTPAKKKLHYFFYSLKEAANAFLVEAHKWVNCRCYKSEADSGTWKASPRWWAGLSATGNYKHFQRHIKNWKANVILMFWSSGLLPASSYPNYPYFNAKLSFH